MYIQNFIFFSLSRLSRTTRNTRVVNIFNWAYILTKNCWNYHPTAHFRSLLTISRESSLPPYHLLSEFPLTSTAVLLVSKSLRLITFHFASTSHGSIFTFAFSSIVILKSFLTILYYRKFAATKNIIYQLNINYLSSLSVIKSFKSTCWISAICCNVSKLGWILLHA